MRASAVISIESKMYSQIKRCDHCLHTGVYHEERVKKNWSEEEALRSG